MNFRQSGQRDDRRRRVLHDVASDTAATARSGDHSTSVRGSHDLPPRRSENYGDAAFMDRQPRLTDLVPIRLSGFVVLFAAGLLIVVILEALYAWMPRLASMTSDGRVATFDLDGEGSLAVWFSSMTLALAGLAAVLIFTVRRHKKDDYRGHYRIWLWAAACCFLLSIDETASLHEGFKEMMVVVTGARLFGDGSIWWVSVYGLVLAAVGTRLLVDMRDCRLSTAAFVAAATCYAVAVVTQLGWVLPETGARGVMAEEGAEMVGNLLLLMALGLYARHVILDAEGLLPKQKTIDLDEDEDDDEAMIDRTVTVHPPHGVPRPTRRTAASRPKTTAVTAGKLASQSKPLAAHKARLKPPQATAVESSQSEPATSVSDVSDGEGAETEVRRKMTKAERKALRKRLRKMRSQREQQQDQ